jgi:hypothetical protein
MEKSANQLWRESNTSLSFKDWIQREKDKGVQIKNKLLEDVVGSVKETNQKDTDTNKRFDFGIPKWVIYTGASVLTFAIVYKLYKAKK